MNKRIKIIYWAHNFESDLGYKHNQIIEGEIFDITQNVHFNGYYIMIIPKHEDEDFVKLAIDNKPFCQR